MAKIWLIKTDSEVDREHGKLETQSSCTVGRRVLTFTVSWRRKQGSVRVGALALDFGEIYDWRALNAQRPAEG